jgi:hypothetical protein
MGKILYPDWLVLKEQHQNQLRKANIYSNLMEVWDTVAKGRLLKGDDFQLMVELE